MNDASGRAYWERNAHRYDRSMMVLGKPMPRMIALVAEAVRGTERVLEIGCGSGLVTGALAGSAKEVVATDYAAEMVNMTAARLRSIDNVRCQQADIYDLPFAPASFDAVVAANVLHLVPDLPRATAALSRVVRPGGLLVLPTFVHAETKISRVISMALAATGFPGARRFTRASLRRAVTEQGLVVVREEALAGVIPIGYIEARGTG